MVYKGEKYCDNEILDKKRSSSCVTDLSKTNAEEVMKIKIQQLVQVYQSPMQILQSDIAECNDNINEAICKGPVQANYLPKNRKFSGQF